MTTTMTTTNQDGVALRADGALLQDVIDCAQYLAQRRGIILALSTDGMLRGRGAHAAAAELRTVLALHGLSVATPPAIDAGYAYAPSDTSAVDVAVDPRECPVALADSAERDRMIDLLACEARDEAGDDPDVRERECDAEYRWCTQQTAAFLAARISA